MAKREINIFGTSFLDLLSGALAAVIILFVIVPKMTAEQQQTLEEIERINIQVNELGDLMEQVRNSVPQQVFEEIQNRLSELQNTISELEAEVANIQNRLASVEEENQSLREEIEQLRDVQNSYIELEEENRRLQEQIAQQNENNTSSRGISDGKVFGMNAKLGIVCMWQENTDVDLHVKNLATGEVCYYGAKTRNFGSLMEDIITRSTPDDDRYELFYQTRIVPGRYQIYVNIYHNSQGSSANVEGYIIMNPGKPNQIKISYGPLMLLQKNVNSEIGILVVTEDNIHLQ